MPVLLSTASFFQADDKWLFIIPTLSIVGLAVVFVGLWKLSQTVLNKITTENKTTEKFRVDQIFVLNLIGFYLIVVALLGLSQGGISLYFYYFHQGTELGINYPLEVNSQTLFYIIANSLKLIIGITMLIRPHGWAKLFYKFRTFGLSKK